MKNVVMILMGIIIAVLAVAVGRMQQRLHHPPATVEADQIKGYLELVERYSQITHDQSKTGTAAVLYTKELFKGSSPDVAAAFFTDLLPQTHDVATQRAIRLELVDIYLHNTKPDKDKAMEQLKALLTAGPTTMPSSPVAAN